MDSTQTECDESYRVSIENVSAFKNYAFTADTPKVPVVRRSFKVWMCSLTGRRTRVFRRNYAWLGDRVTSKDVVSCLPVRTAVFSETLTKWETKRSTRLKKIIIIKEQNVNKRCPTTCHRKMSYAQRDGKHSVTAGVSWALYHIFQYVFNVSCVWTLWQVVSVGRVTK